MRELTGWSARNPKARFFDPKRENISLEIECRIEEESLNGGTNRQLSVVLSLWLSHVAAESWHILN